MTWLSVIGFAATIFCYLGVNLFLSGLHSYSSGK
jgi:ABC-type transport system involved in cytochrome c biogenesis permease subunit